MPLKPKFCLLLALLYCASLCAENWTVLVYMAADNNLWQNAALDVNDMESVDIPSNLKLVVQTDMPDSSPYPGGQRRLIRKDTYPQISSPVLADLGPIDSGDPQTLKSFVNWGFQRYPAERKMLVIWGHGDNWFKANEPKWICPDDGSGSLISVCNGELRLALTGIPQLDILLFDACSMQSLEVLAEVQNTADYVIGSEELVPAAGFPYQTMIPLFANASVEQIASQITQKYLESYEPGGIQKPDGFTNPITCSAIKTSALPAFRQVFSELLCVNSKYLAPAIVQQIRPNLWEMNTAYCDVDIEEFIAACTVITAGPELRDWLALVLAKWHECVVFAGSLNIPHAQVGSAALWFPWHRQYFDAWWLSWRKLDFAGTRWLGWLNYGLGDPVPPGTPQIAEKSVVLGSLEFRIIQPADPDSLSYYVYLYQDGEKDTELFQFHPSLDAESFWVKLPVRSLGRVAVRCLDTCGNWSDSTSFAYEFIEPDLDLLVAPNPVRDGAVASARWYLPEGVSGEVQLTMYNMRGQRVLSNTFNQSQAGEGLWLLSAEDDFHKLGRGVYILRMQIGKKWRHRKLTIL